MGETEVKSLQQRNPILFYEERLFLVGIWELRT